MRLAILGASGHGKVVADTALEAGWEQVVFFDDAWPDLSENGGWPVQGRGHDLTATLADYDGVVVGIGNNRIRLSKQRELSAAGARLATVVHPKAVVSRSAVVGAGSVVFAGAVIQVGSRLGEACILNTRASIDHDCVLENGVHVCPGVSLAGLVKVGKASWIGIGSSVRQLVRIGRDVIVGAGAVVVHDVPDGQTVVGVPAKPMRRSS